MSKPLTQGEKNRRANIRAMKAIGVKNAKLRAKAVAANVAEHLARMEDRRILAIIDRRDRAAAGIARRDAHNAALKAAASVVDGVQMRMELVAVNDNGSTMTVTMKQIAA